MKLSSLSDENSTHQNKRSKPNHLQVINNSQQQEEYRETGTAEWNKKN
jgi:hypothetical protein